MTIHPELEESPYSLLDLSASIISKHPLSIACSTRDGYALWPGVALPAPAAEALYESCKNDQVFDNRQMSLFMSGSLVPVSNLDLEGSLVTDKMLNQLVRSQTNNLRKISLRNCRLLSHEANDLLGSPQVYLPRLEQFDLGNLVCLFKRWADDTSDVRRYMDSVQQSSGPEESPTQSISTGPFSWDYRSMTPFQNYVHSDLRASSSLSSPADASAGRFAASPAGYGAALDGNATAVKCSTASVMDRSGSEATAGSVSPDVFHDSQGTSHAEKCLNVFSRSIDRSASLGFVNHITTMCPNLLALTLHGDTFDIVFDSTSHGGTPVRASTFLVMVLDPVCNLLYLDISYWPSFQNLRFLQPLFQLETLILHDVPELANNIDEICAIKTLKRLDLSQADPTAGKYAYPAKTLYKIVARLPLLTCLDIANTNLASHPSEGDEIWHTVGRLISQASKQNEALEAYPIMPSLAILEESNQSGESTVASSDIISLRGLSQPLEFLGLFGCDGAATFRNIPAMKVAGEGDESQVMTSCEQYLQRPNLIHRVLSEIYRIYRYENPVDCHRALLLVVRAMEIHSSNAEVQVSGSAALFYIMKTVEFTQRVRNRVVSVFLRALKEHVEEQVLVRNCCLSLCQFEVPKDLMFAYIETARLLLVVIENHPSDVMTQRIVVYLLNSMACHVEGQQKVAVGELGAVVKILDLIQKRLEAKDCDEVMEVSWSFLWNITDETPTNCEKFLKGRGMELFNDCYVTFSDKNDLLRNMMGLMGNIAEVPWLRHHLMHANYVNAFVSLMSNDNDGIEISYNSAGVLSHMVSDTSVQWPTGAYTRSETMDEIVKATNGWSLTEKRYINYRSFEPIIRLLPICDCPAAQHWAVWALANLTSVDKSKKYCRYVEEEGGVSLLEKIRDGGSTPRQLRTWAGMVLDNVRKWHEEEAAGVPVADEPAPSP